MFQKSEILKVEEIIRLVIMIVLIQNKNCSDVQLRIKNVSRLMIGNLNVSSMSGKSDQLNSIIEKILCLMITIDNKLKFDEHLTNICIKTYRELAVLTRMGKYLDFSEARRLFKSFSNIPKIPVQRLSSHLDVLR